MNEENEITGDGGLSQLDRYLRALSEKHRRYTLYYLDDHGVANSEELARHIVVQKSGCRPSAVSDEERKRIQTKLHHQHLPRLKDYGLVDYDKRSKDVRLADPPQAFRMLLHLCELVENR